MGRRFFLAMGSGRYRNLPEQDQLTHVTTDVAAMATLFESFGYQRALPGLGEYDGADQLRQKLSHWSHDARLTRDDVVVLYFAGHGVVEERDRHYLLCWDSEEENLAATALPTEELVRILCRGELRQLLVLLDTCSGGAGNADAAAVALQTLAYRHSGNDVSTALYFLASARRRDVAQDGAFPRALGAAITTTTERTGQRQRYLDLTELVKAVNERFEADGHGQRAELASGLVTGLAPFLPNAGYREDLPPVGTDLEFQRRAVDRAVDRDLTEHFGPRSRGVEFESEQGMYFSGRVRVLSELVAWLTAPAGDGKGRVITGSPGCGKSAVLGRIVALSDPAYRRRLDLDAVPPSTVVPENCVTVSVHVRHKRLEEVVARIAASLDAEADGTAALLQELTRRGRQGSVVVVVDAVDEAGSDTAADSGGHGEPRRIARELLRPMSEIPGVRLLIGTRRELVSSLGPTLTVLDLDHPDYRANERDVAGYVTRVLLAAEEPDVRTPYRGRPDLAGPVADAVAERAAGVYLYARTTARTLRSDATPVDIAQPGWEEALPSEIGGAFDDYLARFGPDEPRVRRMLLALAFSEGKGLPRGLVWTTLSSAISGVECTENDISWVLDVAEAYVAEVTDGDRRSAYRLYHKALAEHLRATADRSAEEIQSLIVDALTSMAPRPGERTAPDWFAAPPYVNQHLATHAEAAGRLPELIEDPGFLLASEPLALLRALGAVQGEPGDSHRRIRSAYEQIAHRLADVAPLRDRAADLQLSARRCGADTLADRVNDLGVALPWTARWAWWSTSGTHRVLSGHEDSVMCVAVGDLDGRPIAVTGSWDKTLRVWDLATQRQIGEPLDVGVQVRAVAIGEVDDYTVALSGGVDGVIRVWDLSTGHELGPPLTGHTSDIRDLSTCLIDKRPVVLSASSDGTARLWDLRTRRQIGRDLAAHKRTVEACALGEIGGRPIAVTGGEDKRAYVWDIAELFDSVEAPYEGIPLKGHSAGISAVAIGQRDGQSVTMLGDSAGTLSLWDLNSRQQIGEPVTAHVGRHNRQGVNSATIGVFDGRPIALTSGKLDARLWDLRTLRQLDHPLRGHTRLMTHAALVDRPEGAMAVSVGTDQTARIWDLRTDQPAAGHTARVTSVACTSLGGGDLMTLTGSEDGTARAWDTGTGAQIGRPMEGHAGNVIAVALGEVNGRAVALTGGSDCTIRIWDPFSNQLLNPPLEGHTNEVTLLAVARLGPRPVVVSGSEDGTVRLWDFDSGQTLMTLFGHVGALTHMAVRQVDQALEIAVATGVNHAYLWEVKPSQSAPEARQLRSVDFENLMDPSAIVGLNFHGVQPIVLVRDEGYSVVALDIRAAQRVGATLGSGAVILSGHVTSIAEQPVMVTMDTQGVMRVCELRGHGRELAKRETRPYVSGGKGVFACGRMDGSAIAAVAYDEQVRIWDLSTLEPRGEPLCGEEQPVTTMALAPAQRGGIQRKAILITGTRDGAIRQHLLSDGRQVAEHILMPRGLRRLCPFLNASGSIDVVGCGWMGAEVLDLTVRRARASHHGRWDMAFPRAVSGGVVIATVSEDLELHVWDGETQAELFRAATGHKGRITSLCFGTVAGSEVVGTSSYDGTVRLWELLSGRAIGQWCPDPNGRVLAMDIGCIEGREVICVGDESRSLRFWDLNSDTSMGPDLEPLVDEPSEVRLADIHGRPTAVAAEWNGLLHAWDIETAKRRADIDVGAMIYDLCLSPDGDLCVGTDKGVVALRLAEFTAGESDGGRP